MKRIPFNKNYSVTKDGRVFSHLSNRYLSINISGAGYASVQLSSSKGKIRYYVHRLVAITYLGVPPKNKRLVNHIDGNKLNNNLENLEWMNSTQNALHAIYSGLRRIGDANPDRKLDEIDIFFIQEVNSLFTHQELGDILGVTRSHIGGIINGRRRKTYTKM